MRSDRAGRSDRGQLLLVGGLTLALLLVVLAILLNGVIYAENTATRSGDASQEALEYRDAVVGPVGGLLDAENANDAHADRNDIDTALAEGEEEIDRQLHDQFLRRGAATDFERTGSRNGYLFAQDESGPFVDDNGDDYPKIENVEATRAFRIDLDGLTETSDPVNESFQVVLSNSSAFGSNEYRYYLYENGGETRLAVGDENDDDPEVVCAIAADPTDVRVDLTGGYLTDGDQRVPCRGGEWPVDDDPYDIEFVNGNAAEGTFSMTVVTEESLLNLGIGEEDRASITEAIYSLDVTIWYDSQSTEYESTARIAPGEPP